MWSQCSWNTLWKQIIPQASSVLCNIAPGSWDQQSVYSVLVYKPMVFHWRVLMLTTSWYSRALDSMSFSIQQSLVLLCLQSGQYESNSSQQNEVHLHQAVDTQHHPLDLQAYLKKPNHLEPPVPIWMESQYYCHLKFQSNSRFHHNVQAFSVSG